MSRRQFTKEFKEAAVRRLELGASLAEVARACEVNPNVLHRWKRELHELGVKAFAGNGKTRAEETRIAELERKVGRQATAYLDRKEYPTGLKPDRSLISALHLKHSDTLPKWNYTIAPNL